MRSSAAVSEGSASGYRDIKPRARARKEVASDDEPTCIVFPSALNFKGAREGSVEMLVLVMHMGGEVKQKTMVLFSRES